jgi:hypothetical protein
MDSFGNSHVGLVIVVMALLLGVGLYFLPSIIASKRNHSNATSIIVLNLFLGWTFLGWVAALIWAFSDNTLIREAPIDGGYSGRNNWGIIAICATIAIVAIAFATDRAKTGASTGNVVQPAVPAPQASESETPRPTTHADTEEFRQSILNSGFQTYTNSRYGFRIDYPESFISQQPPENGDGLTLRSADGKAELSVSGMNSAGFTLKDEFDRAVKDVHGELGYNKMGSTWFVVTWTDGDSMGYTKEFVGPDSQNSFIFTFPVDQRPQYDSIVTRIEKSFKPGDLDISH